MQVRLRTTIAGPGLTAGPGDVISLDETTASALVESGYAEVVTDGREASATPTSASVTPSETAMSGPARRRRRFYY
jgi:hypothetical protein